MKMLSILLTALTLGCCTCVTITAEATTIRALPQYNNLSKSDKNIMEEIIDKALKSDRKEYYFKKLSLLLTTPINPAKVIEEKQRAEIQKSIERSKQERREIAEESQEDLEDYIWQEEWYESSIQRVWRGYQPRYGGPYFYVADEDPTDLLVHIKVHVEGTCEMVEKIILLEDAIEKHLWIPGFSVNLEFVGHSADDVFDVRVDPSSWPTSENWASGYEALAHELMHLMGLPDEYDRIENHAENKDMTISQRLRQFLAQMDDNVPPDAKNGIMCRHWRKPLDRHACAAVGLGEECVKARVEAFNSAELEK